MMTDLPPAPSSERTDRLYHVSLLVYVVVLLASVSATGGYSLFEQFADAPRISMYWAFLFAVLAWSAAWIALRRRVS
jgi:hypothetical protein